jgi:predicted hotdog family 3-hydroxylacyl-ACP dehydratase
MNALPPIEQLLPHRAPMLLIDAVLDFDGARVRCSATPRADAWYAQADGAMPSWIGIELMAQALAAHVGLTALRAGRPPRPGVLLGTRILQSAAASYPAGRTLLLEAVQTFREGSGLASYDCAIDDAGGARLASAAITAFEPPDFERFIEEHKR